MKSFELSKKRYNNFFPSTDKIFEGLNFPDENIELKPANVHGKLKLGVKNSLETIRNNIYFRQPVFMLTWWT